MEHIHEFVHSLYYQHFRMLLELDLVLLKGLFRMFFADSFVPKMKEFVNVHQQMILEIEKDLKPFFDEESASIKFTEFWMKN